MSGRSALRTSAWVHRAIPPERAKARLVELRYFAGLTGDQAAQALGISPPGAARLWAFAQAWLHRELIGTAADPEPSRNLA